MHINGFVCIIHGSLMTMYDAYPYFSKIGTKLCLIHGKIQYILGTGILYGNYPLNSIAEQNY